MVKVIPSAPTDNLNDLRNFIKRSEGVVDRFSVDMVDGKYADNKTIDPSELEGFQTNLLLDFQLMVLEPVNWIERCVPAGADRIIGHIEHMGNQLEFVKKVKELGLKPGLGLDLKTPISNISTKTIGDLDVVLLMSVSAGFGGQEFQKEVIEKIGQLSDLRKKNKYTFKIHVDGGITTGNIKSVVEAGADEVSIGVRIFQKDLEENIKRIEKAVK